MFNSSWGRLIKKNNKPNFINPISLFSSMLEKEKMQKIYEIQKQMQDKFRNVPKKGENIDYLGRKFIVFPTVFWPSWDSQALVKNYSINSGEVVLDLCTGSGVIAIFSAIKGASKVVALDINPEAIKCTKENAIRHNVEKIVDARVSDMFGALNNNEKFDVITINPPFTLHDAKDFAEKTVWDQDLHVQKTFFKNVKKYLKISGRIYITGAKWAIETMKETAREKGFSITQIGETKVDEERVFYAFELKI